MAPVQGVINQMQSGYGQMQNLGQQLMDPNSAMNEMEIQKIQEQSADQLAMQHMLARRQAAAMGQDSGITAAQNRASQAQMSRGVQQQSQQKAYQNEMRRLATKKLNNALNKIEIAIDIRFWEQDEVRHSKFKSKASNGTTTKGYRKKYRGQGKKR